MVASVPRLVHTVFPLFIILWSAASDAFGQPVTQPFTFSLVEHTLPHVEHAVSALGDYDNDGDLDVLLMGIVDDDVVAGLYRNDGIETRETRPTFVFVKTDADVLPLVYGSAAWGDYDGDGDLDLVVTGSRGIDPPYEPEAMLYRNDGGELAATDVQLVGFHSGEAAWGDFDNDGDLDLLLGGEREGSTSETRLYRNESGAFVDTEADLPGIAYGDAAWGDADGDQDLDLVLTGVSKQGIYADVYQNDGGLFSRIESELIPGAFGDVDWGDFNNDGDLDIIQTGGRFSPNILEGFARVYQNTNAAFDSLETGLPGALSGAGTWGDYDNDGDLDLLLMGAVGDIFGRRLARIFANEASGLTEKIHFVGVVFGSATWGDLDEDGDLDLLASGRPTVGASFINIYENRRQVINPPLEPSKLASSVSPGTVTLRWNRPAVRYASFNIRVGSKPGFGDVVAPMSDLETGRRLVSAAGNAQLNSSWTIRDLKPGTYYWSVQAVDPAFAASRFASEQQFTIAEATSSEGSEDLLPGETTLHPIAPNPSTGPVTLYYDLAQHATVAIRIHDLLGRTIAIPVDREQGRGRHSVVWDGRDAGGASVASGLYLCELRSGTTRQTVTLIIAR